MRTTTLLEMASVLTIALGAPRAARCSELDGHPPSRAALVVSLSANGGSASARTFRGFSSPGLAAPGGPAETTEAVSAAAHLVTAAANLDQRLPLRVRPTWGTIAGHAHAGFSLSGRF